MVGLPKYYDLCPHVDLYYGPGHATLVVCVRRWTTHGKVRTEDGTYLWDRADNVLTLPIGATSLGQVILRMLSASRQCGKQVPPLAKPVREAVNVLDRDAFNAAFYPLGVWTHRDTTTPYVIGVAFSPQVNVAPVLVPKDAPNEVLGNAMLTVLAKVQQLYWGRNDGNSQ